ncbi:hypothetical protein [Paenibacillus mendelii]|uniref:Uncharacterized protein n=1 Tax=Paenibacillus mendelii TaxID=206163 RepID=A0ABV6JJF0_9BACL|nr:hypothetical protein [Paenibacillus mendelii]MCQ6558972.1 hypothetical protein [Paenibacillus mendelii]
MVNPPKELTQSQLLTILLEIHNKGENAAHLEVKEVIEEIKNRILTFECIETSINQINWPEGDLYGNR